MKRRQFLHNAGVFLWLPVLESLVPQSVFAQSLSRSRFVMVFTPSGMLMPGGENGNWTFEGALKPLVDAGLRSNSMIVRGLRADGGTDPHWLNTAGFLSCKPIKIANDRPTECGKTFDQYVADKNPTLLRSLHVGFKPMNRDFSADHGGYSDRYLDTLSFRADNRPIGNTYSPQALFDQVFGGGAAGSRHIRALNQRRKSIIDGVIGELGSVKRSLSSTDKPRFEAYLDGMRDIEKTLSTNINNAPTCIPAGARPGPTDYLQQLQVMQSIVAQAFQCNLISSATIMYDDGVGDQFLVHPGGDHDHHGYAHHGNEAANMAKLNAINVRHGDLFAKFVGEMKTRGQLDSTLVMWGSNMSDGNTHNTANLPVVVCGGGAGLKFGQEVNAARTSIPKANLFVELAEIYGLALPVYGSDASASDGTRIGIKV